MNADYIARKERWARKMAGKESSVPRSEDRLPPGQHLVTDFPVLDLGIKPDVPPDDWRLQILGEVDEPKTFTLEELTALPRFTDVSDFHCVTTWTQFDMKFSGVAFFTIADLVRPRQSAKYLIMQSYDGYSTSMPLDAMLDDDVMIATHWNDLPLDLEHGGPARILVPKRYAWKSAKWIRELRFSAEDELGFWEKRGYSNTADPHTNDRFATQPKLP
ncbi:MAG: molybdopterin-dependent oxidoreductase [Verrucomicrobiae bacterium]|jgi:DMSO/TMAO reductase YedYZ molybdopterin-dependent catalytic subunit|nr:molybdopterin-dependent oxidoreductase [Verrucomicrobiae bacterium]